jgi:hypothetical protein
MIAIRRILWLMLATCCTAVCRSPVEASTLEAPRQLIASYNDEQSATLRWEAVPGARYYRFQISEQRDFSVVRTDALILQGKTWVRATVGGLEPRRPYWWRVQALGDGVQSSWSVPVRIATSEWGVEQPQSLVPADGSTLAYCGSLRLGWKSCDGATTYRVQIASGERFDDPIELVTSEPFVVAANLIAGRTYYWRVAAQRGSQSSAWSSVQRFSIAPLVPGTESISSNSGLRLLSDEDRKQAIVVAPNPVSDVVTIRSALLESGDADVTLFDVAGRRVLTMPLPTTQTASVPVGQLPAGSYTMVIRTGTTKWIGTVDVLR